MAQIFFKKSAARPSAFATLGLIIVFLAMVTLLGAGPVLGFFQPTSPVPEELFAWRLKLLDLTNILLLAGSSVTLVGILHGRFSSRVRTSWRGFLAVLIAALVAAPLWYLDTLKTQAAEIHDITTSITDPPYFEHLAERSYDTNVPAGMKGGRLDIAYQKLHEDTYGDLASMEFDKELSETRAAAMRAVSALGWTIESNRKGAETLEASYLMPVLGLRSNIVVRVRSVDAGKQSMLDIRAVSLLGVTDYGVNAHLIREFEKAVRAELS